MGAGKTTVGKQLAEELKRKFYDSDVEIERTTGVDLAWIFDVEGEDGFRERECEAIDKLSQKQAIILSTGGGVVINSENRKNLASRGIVIYLKAGVEHQLKRMDKDQRRPLLRTEDKEQRLKSLTDARESFYLDVADHVVDTNGVSVKNVVAKILELINS